METLWQALGGEDGSTARVRFVGERAGLASPYDVHGFAEACVAVAALAVSAFDAARRGHHPGALAGVEVDRKHVAAAFRSERHLVPVGWNVPPAWDPIAGDYPTRDGWIRLHTNYTWHRDPALRALGVGPADANREVVADRVVSWAADALETAVVEAGGCAAACRTAAEWAAHAQGRAVAAEPLLAFATHESKRAPDLPAPGEAPLSGIRVLDLTRVIAGPVATRFLASHGAEVLRVDPPGFDEVAALLPDTTWGKRRCALDLRAPTDRATFGRLVAGAQVLVHGYRRGALPGLGLDPECLRILNPGLVVVGLNAYGQTGPWADRRGFDSLVQMSAGLADTGRRAGGEGPDEPGRPVPLPAQALDHGAGYLVAAAVARALSRRLEGEVISAHVSLARTALELARRGTHHDPRGPALTNDDVVPFLDLDESGFGPVHRVRAPGIIDGAPAVRLHPAGPLGMHAAAW